MTNNNKNEKSSILGNVLKGVAALALAAIAGSVSGKAHSNLNENERRNNTDNMEKAFSTKNKGE